MVDTEYTNIRGIYDDELKNIIDNKNVKAIFIVGSAKNIEYENVEYMNDIDLFVIIQEGSGQVREIKFNKGIEFDINYFPIYLVDNLINNSVYFFLDAMKDAKIVYDVDNLGKLYIEKCFQKYNKGPNELTKSEQSKLVYEVQNSLKRLEENDIYDKFEYELLANLYIRDVIRSYFMLNKKWIPKDKKLFSILKKENEELYKLVKTFYQDYSRKDLQKIYNYVFKNIKVYNHIKINY